MADIEALAKRGGKTRYLTVVDDETGETIVYCKLGSKRHGLGAGGDFVALYQEAATWIGGQDITGEQAKVLFCIMGMLDYENYVRIPRKDIAEAARIKPEAVSRAMKGLKDLGIIMEGPMAGRYKTYRFDPRIAHKGRNLRQTVIEYDDLRKRRKAREQEQGNEE